MSGASGHMLHPYDCDSFTLQDLKEFIGLISENKIEDTRYGYKVARQTRSFKHLCGGW